MAQAGSRAASRTAELLRGEAGLSHAIGEIAQLAGVDLAPIPAQQVAMRNIAADLAERTAGAKYPLVHVYCEKVVNQLREKFRTFSGKTHLVIEVRVSQDRIEEIEQQLQLYVEAALRILDGNRGEWGNGMFYGGGYEVTFSPVKQGGKHYLQTAKISFAVDVSI